ncbi:MAG: hypothetical protein V1867_01840 [Candidatus Falkowbacteria bacterium]
MTKEELMVFQSLIIPFPWEQHTASEEEPGLYVMDEHEGYRDYYDEGDVKALQRYFREHPETLMKVMNIITKEFTNKTKNHSKQSGLLFISLTPALPKRRDRRPSPAT